MGGFLLGIVHGVLALACLSPSSRLEDDFLQG
jgi:hypothetical protein